MRLSFPSWQQTPWGKANAGQWRYALRNSLAMCLSLWIAFALNLDEPYWAMTSAAVVSFPTVGGVISKSIGRVIGSLIGAAASLMIAGHCLNDPWLFTFVIAAWIGLCTFVSNHYQNNVSYAFALAGYTTAIIAFSTVNTTDTQQIFDIAQARVCEVITGILCGGLMMMLLPSTSDGEALLTSLRRMQSRLLEHAELLWQTEQTPQIRTSHEGLIGQILTMNLLRIQAFWSHYRLRRHNNVLNFILHRQLRITSVITSLRRMLVNWPSPPENLPAVLNQLLTALQQPDCDKYQIARILQRIAPHDEFDYRHRAFWLRLRHFCWLYLQVNRWLAQLDKEPESGMLLPPAVTSLARHTDTYEAAYNGLRTFVCIVIGCAFWINTQWSSGAAALSLAAVSCVLYSATPSPTDSIATLVKAIILLSIGCFILKFGVMVQIDDFWQFAVVLFPILITMQMMKLQHPAYASLWGQLIVFMGSFLSVTNPPSYDYQEFLNDNIGKLVGVMLAGVAFQILRPSSDKRKSRRIVRMLRRDFIDQLSAHPQQSQNQFESLIYHRINQLNLSKDQPARLWLLRWGIVLLNCSHVVWQLRDWQTTSAPLSAVRDVCIHCLKGCMTEKGIQPSSLQATLQELQRMSAILGQYPDATGRELAGLIWRLYCSLTQLQMAVPGEESKVAPA
ncbi:FUSC family protein [Yersinia enterocolitica]|uniref:FUSC family protein n=1 Tax=Yersinia enterocolitica TaxID=630 RepID=UPI0005E9F02C|nr:FUSC family protein [Yersinia enterocolitica]EKN4035106.1 FUSC family protein [Yersinia enterocolitica]EKN4177709.1 FUSC family protein [Yersinia enterocolitica]EKN6052864.1 FUSC family protein [Yersinia enterocolitica]ELI8151924.1 FUSC family protein [Yersinia enterocolitica]EMA9249887.1 FUSC family protein [Yersinia enterocolitica]